MSVSYQMSWGQHAEDETLLKVVTTETYRCLAPVDIAQDPDGRMGWRLRYVTRDFNPDFDVVCWTVEEMLAQGWIEKVDR